MVSIVKLMDFNPQTASNTPFREPSPAISHLLKIAFSPEKRENILNGLIRLLTDIKSLRNKVESSANLVYKKSMIKGCYSFYISITFER